MPSRGRVRKAAEQHSRVIDVDSGWNGADKSNQFLAGDNPDSTVPLGQPARRTQRPGEETHFRSHVPSKVPCVPAAASRLPVLPWDALRPASTARHSPGVCRQEDERVTAM